MKYSKKLRLVGLLVAGILLISGCSKKQENQPAVQNPLDGDLVCMEYNSYTGYIGGKYVSNVAAMLVMNQSGEFLEYATVQCDIGPRKGTFRIEGLPPGRMCWVFEQDLMSLSHGERFVAMGCDDYYFNPNAQTVTDDISVSIDGSTMSVTNCSEKKLTNVAVYFKNLYGDGVYFGGDAYMVTFSALDPGQTGSKQHPYLGDSSQIVKYSYQEG